jgi:hypothetical protein
MHHCLVAALFMLPEKHFLSTGGVAMLLALLCSWVAKFKTPWHSFE